MMRHVLAIAVLLGLVHLAAYLSAAEPATGRALHARELFTEAKELFGVDNETARSRLHKSLFEYDEALEHDPGNVALFAEMCAAQRWRREHFPKPDPSVDRSLVWIARQQHGSGHWELAAKSGGQESTNNERPRLFDDRSKIGATSLALLAFLGAGKTSREGEYKNAVEAGLQYLGSEIKLADRGADMRGKGGGATTQALATMVLCDAYGSTGDWRLRMPAQRAVEFLEALQDERDGGWSDRPDEPEDTVVTAWCVLALQSAVRADLAVSPLTVARTKRFLDRMQSDDGAAYGRTESGKDYAATAAGLLCRSLLGWNDKHDAMQRGVAYLAEDGPQMSNLEATFFAHQVVLHFGKDAWREWNTSTRELWLKSQVGPGNEAGSWHFPDEVAAKTGGRLYHTALVSLSLEAYYGYLGAFTQRGKGLADLR